LETHPRLRYFERGWTPEFLTLMLGQQSTAPGSPDRIATAAENVDRLQRGASIVVIRAG
jgi:hypothetical protein